MRPSIPDVSHIEMLGRLRTLGYSVAEEFATKKFPGSFYLMLEACESANVACHLIEAALCGKSWWMKDRAVWVAKQVLNTLQEVEGTEKDRKLISKCVEWFPRHCVVFYGDEIAVFEQVKLYKKCLRRQLRSHSSKQGYVRSPLCDVRYAAYAVMEFVGDTALFSRNALSAALGWLIHLRRCADDANGIVRDWDVTQRAPDKEHMELINRWVKEGWEEEDDT